MANFANRLAASANEGIRPADLEDTNKCERCINVVERALRNELLGHENARSEKLLASMDCVSTGVLLYLPNVSINLCFLVRLKAELGEIETLAEKADHKAEFTAVTIPGDPAFRQICRGVPFSRRAVLEIARKKTTLADWCEGSLVPFYFALRYLERPPELSSGRERRPTRVAGRAIR